MMVTEFYDQLTKAYYALLNTRQNLEYSEDVEKRVKTYLAFEEIRERLYQCLEVIQPFKDDDRKLEDLLKWNIS